MADVLRVCALYPDLMNIYADRGNLQLLRKRCEWRGIGFELSGVGLEDPLDPDAARPLLHRRRPGPRPGAVRRGPRHDQARRAPRSRERGQGHLRRLRRLPAARPRLRVRRRQAARHRPRRPRDRPRGRPAADRQRRDRGRPRRDQATSWPASRTTAAAPGSATRRPLGRVLKGHGNDGRCGFEGVRAAQRHRHLSPRSVAPQERLVRGLADRRRPPASYSQPLDDTLEDAAHAAARRAPGSRNRVASAAPFPGTSS